MAAPFPAQTSTVPKDLRWSPEAAEKARKTGGFIQVGTGRQTASAYIGGAQTRWQRDDANDRNIIYDTTHRLVGSEASIRAALGHADVSAREIDAAIANAITSDNYQSSKQDLYEAEKKNREALRGPKTVIYGYDWDQILWFADNRDSALPTQKPSSKDGKAKTGGAKAPRGALLVDKLAKLKPDQVLDVSNMDDTSRGAKPVPMPKDKSRAKFKGDFSRDVRIVSNNLDKYISALQFAYGDEVANVRDFYRGEIAAVREQLAGRSALPAAPVASSSAAPPAGAVLPPKAVLKPRVASPGALATTGNTGAALPRLPAAGRR